MDTKENVTNFPVRPIEPYRSDEALRIELTRERFEIIEPELRAAGKNWFEIYDEAERRIQREFYNYD